MANGRAGTGTDATTVDLEAPAEPVIVPAHAPAVEIVPREPEHWDASVFHAPHYKAPLVGHVARGAIIPLRGQVTVVDAPYCQSELYYALSPFGFLCADDAELSEQSVTAAPVLQVPEDGVLPFTYAMVQTPEEELVPLFRSPEDAALVANPKRLLARGDTLAVEEQLVRVEGVPYRRTIDGDLVSADKTYRMRRFSGFGGIPITADMHLPFGWVKRHKARVYDAPDGDKVELIERRTRVDIVGEETIGRRRWLKLGEGRFVRADDVNEVNPIARPDSTLQNEQWIDIDLGEQVVVAYRGARPEYATMTSSGRPPHSTPRGDYPVWAKASAISMRSQPYDDKPYYVDRVPWVLFFQAHNALHGAYWHDRFGAVKSHGCANLSPKDARFLFEWLQPGLPPGWTAVRYVDSAQAPVVHVRNTRYRTPFKQERPPGPPTPEAEAERLAEAEARREAERLAAEAAGAQTGLPGDPTAAAQANSPSSTSAPNSDRDTALSPAAPTATQ